METTNTTTPIVILVVLLVTLLPICEFVELPDIVLLNIVGVSYLRSRTVGDCFIEH